MLILKQFSQLNLNPEPSLKANLIPLAQVLTLEPSCTIKTTTIFFWYQQILTQDTTKQRDCTHDPLLLYGEHLHCYFLWVYRMSFIKQQGLSCTMHSTYIFGCACRVRKQSREYYFTRFQVTSMNILRRALAIICNAPKLPIPRKAGTSAGTICLKDR